MAPASAAPRIFVSYARSDGKEFAAKLRTPPPGRAWLSAVAGPRRPGGRQGLVAADHRGDRPRRIPRPGHDPGGARLRVRPARVALRPPAGQVRDPGDRRAGHRLRIRCPAGCAARTSSTPTSPISGVASCAPSRRRARRRARRSWSRACRKCSSAARANSSSSSPRCSTRAARSRSRSPPRSRAPAASARPRSPARSATRRRSRTPSTTASSGSPSASSRATSRAMSSS